MSLLHSLTRAVPSRLPHITYVSQRSLASRAPTKQWMCYIPDRPGVRDLKARLRTAHLSHLLPFLDRTVIASGSLANGGSENGEDSDSTGSVYVFTAEDEETVRGYIDDDLYTRHGVWDVERAQITPFDSSLPTKAREKLFGEIKDALKKREALDRILPTRRLDTRVFNSSPGVDAYQPRAPTRAAAYEAPAASEDQGYVYAPLKEVMGRHSAKKRAKEALRTKQIENAASEDPSAETPPAEAPPAEAPPAETPPAKTPPAEAPLVANDAESVSAFLLARALELLPPDQDIPSPKIPRQKFTIKKPPIRKVAGFSDKRAMDMRSSFAPDDTLETRPETKGRESSPSISIRRVTLPARSKSAAGKGPLIRKLNDNRASEDILESSEAPQ
ncbi:hypothetical protein BO71DRAFT_432904 [Aspergillus ellipticus CBS 707.79]|uniref:YCII-related domain-containing protein n=1 Tax=Aspergillus ellipticus CBS 707.79 TaxID=1448320 RepID=A0A319D1M0_9EURO|nr:hypothetical protein BO71DRAFT_432904 [Aspergillus ellipticus CBS 707.79]